MRHRIFLPFGALLLMLGAMVLAQPAQAQDHHDDIYAPMPYDAHAPYAGANDYYYLPQHGIYYSPGYQLYFYPGGGGWMSAGYLPDAYYGVQYGIGPWVSINVRTPWLRHSHWVNQYPYHGGGHHNRGGHHGIFNRGGHHNNGGHHNDSYNRGGHHNGGHNNGGYNRSGRSSGSHNSGGHGGGGGGHRGGGGRSH